MTVTDQFNILFRSDNFVQSMVLEFTQIFNFPLFFFILRKEILSFFDKAVESKCINIYIQVKTN